MVGDYAGAGERLKAQSLFMGYSFALDGTHQSMYAALKANIFLREEIRSIPAGLAIGKDAFTIEDLAFGTSIVCRLPWF